VVEGLMVGVGAEVFGASWWRIICLGNKREWDPHWNDT